MEISLQQNTTLAWVYKLGVLCLLLVPVAAPFGISTTDITMVGVGFFFVLYSCIAQDFTWLRERWVQVMFVLWAYLIINSLLALQPAISLKQSLPFGRFFIFAAALQFWLLTHKKIRHYLLISIAIACSVASLDALIQFFTGVDLIGHTIRDASLHHFVYPWNIQHWSRTSRLTGFDDKMHIGSVISMLATPAIVYFIMSRKIPYLLLTLLIVVITLLAGERNAALMMLFTMGLLFIFIPKIRKTLSVLALVGMLSTLLLMKLTPGFTQHVFEEPISTSRNIISSFSHQHSNTDSNAHTHPYSNLLVTSWNFYKMHPIKGIGLKQFTIHCLRTPPPMNRIPHNYCIAMSSPQNKYLEFLACTGTIGTLLFLSLLYLWGKKIIRYRRALPPIMLGVLAAFLQRVWPFQILTSFFFAWGGMSFWLMGGWLMAYIREKELAQDSTAEPKQSASTA